MTAVYQPGVPTGTVQLDQDYLNLQRNATALNTIFGVDHLPFANTTAQQGYHTDIHFVPVSTTAANPGNYPVPANTPAGIPSYGQLFTAVTGDGFGVDTMLFFKTGAAGGVLNQLTSNVTPGFDATNSGAWVTYLPGGLVMQFGFIASLAGNPTITYPRPFPTQTLNVQITPLSSTILIGSDTYAIWGFANPNASSFRVINAGTKSGASYAAYWMAIGN